MSQNLIKQEDHLEELEVSTFNLGQELCPKNQQTKGDMFLHLNINLK